MEQDRPLPTSPTETPSDATPAEPSAAPEPTPSEPPTEATAAAASTAEEAPAVDEAPVADEAPAEAAAKSPGEAEPEPEAEATEAKAEGRGKGKARAPRSPQVASLYRAFRSKRPVDGTIEKVIKGGYEVRVHKLRAFCPHSQLDLHRVEEPEQHVGKSYPFRITQLRRGGDDIVLSRRALLEDERTEEAKAVRATLLEGAVMRGHVAGLAPFGAFVDLGAGVMGLVHVSELSHSRVTKVDEVVKVGDDVNVKILKLQKSGEKISLSLRQATEDPWRGVAERFAAGQSYPGKVTRIADFGAFVELAPGVEALAPGSEFPPVAGGWQSEVEVGTERSWQVLSVDGRRRRISVTLPVEGGLSADAPIEEKAVLQGKVQRVEKFGVFVWLAPGKVGLMPNVWTGVPRGLDMSRNYPVGSDVEVQVVEVTEGGRRIRLAKNGIEIVEPPREPRERRAGGRSSDRGPQTSEPVSDTSGFGTSLGDKLKAALGQGNG